MDGFDQGSNVKVSVISATPSRTKRSLYVRAQVIMATNRQDTLDPALLRPGRLDRKIEFPLPSRRERRLIFQTVTGKMNLGPDVDLEDCTRQCAPLFISCSRLTSHRASDVSRPDRLSSAEISSVVQAAGLQGTS
jgi:26S proteasome regulatory subunit T3